MGKPFDKNYFFVVYVRGWKRIFELQFLLTQVFYGLLFVYIGNKYRKFYMD